MKKIQLSDDPLATRSHELDQMARDIFESESDASRWLRQPHPMLDGETPLQAACTPHGAQHVKDMLLAIKHGGVV